MKNNLLLWQLFGLTFTAVAGTLLHFLYPWTRCIALAPISAVNESTWEHMKILFVPMLFFAIGQSFFAQDYPQFWWIKLIGIVFGTALIPISFYTLNGAFGTTPDWLNILLFFLCAAIAFGVEFFLFRAYQVCIEKQFIAIILLALLTFCFVVFTFFPPHVPLFLDPVGGGYGIQK